ncbi:hypothetical protein GDO81_026612 [Engystomops pustulosus]|uniref:UPAR/Ly6 domain-containing protein n=1 Tax=Engystomops pustulosus TaxID=76066 RepID=A0AAV6YYU5_ENGPU|nr:hypothetical protein GDO81_026612 [Engystomops pustulosus]
MKPVVISIFLLSLSLYDAAVLNCYQCNAKNNVTCEQTVVECQEGEKCLIISEELQLNGTFPSIYKGCSRNIPCGKTPYSRATNDVSIKFSTKCCDTDLCNANFYEMPEDVAPMGDTCPSCYAPNTLEVCDPGNNTIQCRAKSDRCFVFAGTAEKPDGVAFNFTLGGCMSSLTCQLAPDQLVGFTIFNYTVFVCTEHPTISPTTVKKTEE